MNLSALSASEAKRVVRFGKKIFRSHLFIGICRWHHGRIICHPAIKNDFSAIASSIALPLKLPSRSVWKQVDDHSGGNGSKRRLQRERRPQHTAATINEKKKRAHYRVCVKSVSKEGELFPPNWHEHHRDHYGHANGQQCSFHP